MMTSTGPLPSGESLMKDAAIKWWAELRDFGLPLSDITNYVFRSNIGHFTAVCIYIALNNIHYIRNE